jgi:sialate O-acetylesterase
MEWPVASSANAESELSSSDLPAIRLFIVPKKVAQYPVEDLESGEWKVCTPKSVSSFSAVGYFFGRELYKKLNVAIGLVESAWGGTVAETWMPGRKARAVLTSSVNNSVT